MPGKRYKGDIEGNIFSVSFEEGWMWITPLKDDVYSVGVTLFGEITGNFGRLAVVINNAGVASMNHVLPRPSVRCARCWRPTCAELWP